MSNKFGVSGPSNDYRTVYDGFWGRKKRHNDNKFLSLKFRQVNIFEKGNGLSDQASCVFFVQEASKVNHYKAIESFL